jgi:hypothetical protein
MVFTWTMTLLSFFLSHSLQANADTPDSKRVFVIAVDTSVKTRDLQVSYFLAGEFGGYGSYDVKQDGEGKVLIHTDVEGKPAKSLRAVLYAPHCRIQTIRVDDLEASKREDAFHCSPLGEIELRGKFDRGEIDPDRKLEVEVRYLGFWAHTFLGIFDGPVLTFHFGKAVVEPDGSFRLALPNMAQAVDPPFQTNEDWLEVLVRDSKTGNILAELEPPAALALYGHLKIVENDPGEVEFQAKWRE